MLRVGKTSLEQFAQGFSAFAAISAQDNHYASSARRLNIRISSSFTGAHNQGRARPAPANGIANFASQQSIFATA